MAATKTRTEWWLSCSRMTVWVETEHGIITSCAPIVRKFQGQRFAQLVRWLGRISDGPVTQALLSEHSSLVHQPEKG